MKGIFYCTLSIAVVNQRLSEALKQPWPKELALSRRLHFAARFALAAFSCHCLSIQSFFELLVPLLQVTRSASSSG
jgi:hypothetical protein